jgi:hypothetical protein
MSLRNAIREAIKETSKVSKKSVSYSEGMKNSKCSICDYYNTNNTCDKVKGDIQPNMWCELFENT